MRSLYDYICEGFQEVNVINLKAVFKVEPDPIIFQVPDSFSESDFQIYLGDRFYKGLPGAPVIGKRKFGKNYDNISDAYFEYHVFEKIENATKVDYKWDAHYDNDLNSPSMGYVKITGLKYIMLFDTFTIKKALNEDTNDVIRVLFKNAESNNINKYPLKITLDEGNLKYTENM